MTVRLSVLVTAVSHCNFEMIEEQLAAYGCDEADGYLC